MKVDLDLWVWCEGIKAGARGAKMRASRFSVRGSCLEDRALRTEREEVRSVEETYAELIADLQRTLTSNFEKFGETATREWF